MKRKIFLTAIQRKHFFEAESLSDKENKISFFINVLLIRKTFYIFVLYFIYTKNYAR